MSSVDQVLDRPPHAPTIQKQRAYVKKAASKLSALRELSLLSGVTWFFDNTSSDWVVNFVDERTKRIFDHKPESVWRLLNPGGELPPHASLDVNRFG